MINTGMSMMQGAFRRVGCFAGVRREVPLWLVQGGCHRGTSEDTGSCRSDGGWDRVSAHYPSTGCAERTGRYHRAEGGYAGRSVDKRSRIGRSRPSP